MSRLRLNRTLMAAALALGLGAAEAGAAGPSLADLVQAALAQQPGPTPADAQQGLAGALRQRAEQPLSAPATFNLKHQTDALTDGPGFREWEAGVEMPLWLPGQSAQLRREAAAHDELADAMRDARRLQVSGELRELLWNALIAQSGARQALQAQQLADRLLQDVQRRVAAGELARGDAMLAEQDQLRRREALRQAESEAASAAQAFSLYSGVELPAEFGPEAVLTEPAPLERHPQLRLLQRQVEQARALRERVAGEARPNPSVWLGATRTRAASGGSYDSTLGVQLSVPLGQKAHAAPALAEAERALTEAQFEQRRVQRELLSASQAARLAYSRIESVLADSARRRDLAEQRLKLMRRAFELGEADLVRVLQAQDDALTALAEDVRLNLERGLAAARLNQALGVIPQ